MATRNIAVDLANEISSRLPQKLAEQHHKGDYIIRTPPIGLDSSITPAQRLESVESGPGSVDKSTRPNIHGELEKYPHNNVSKDSITSPTSQPTRDASIPSFEATGSGQSLPIDQLIEQLRGVQTSQEEHKQEVPIENTPGEDLNISSKQPILSNIGDLSPQLETGGHLEITEKPSLSSDGATTNTPDLSTQSESDNIDSLSSDIPSRENQSIEDPNLDLPSSTQALFTTPLEDSNSESMLNLKDVDKSKEKLSNLLTSQQQSTVETSPSQTNITSNIESEPNPIYPLEIQESKDLPHQTKDSLREPGNSNEILFNSAKEEASKTASPIESENISQNDESVTKKAVNTSVPIPSQVSTNNTASASLQSQNTMEENLNGVSQPPNLFVNSGPVEQERKELVSILGGTSLMFPLGKKPEKILSLMRKEPASVREGSPRSVIIERLKCSQNSASVQGAFKPKGIVLNVQTFQDEERNSAASRTESSNPVVPVRVSSSGINDFHSFKDTSSESSNAASSTSPFSDSAYPEYPLGEDIPDTVGPYSTERDGRLSDFTTRSSDQSLSKTYESKIISAFGNKFLSEAPEKQDQQEPLNPQAIMQLFHRQKETPSYSPAHDSSTNGAIPREPTDSKFEDRSPKHPESISASQGECAIETEKIPTTPIWTTNLHTDFKLPNYLQAEVSKPPEVIPSLLQPPENTSETLSNQEVGEIFTSPPYRVKDVRQSTESPHTPESSLEVEGDRFNDVSDKATLPESSSTKI
ncbi:hypothetical protein ABW20_dc0108882 [Dactylellina cionopaga]|nr:hypothetical protein ABW20_dc0108882 [Dactylellina cionopaga]